MCILPRLGKLLHRGKCIVSSPGQANQTDMSSYHTDAVCGCAIASQYGPHTPSFTSLLGATAEVAAHYGILHDVDSDHWPPSGR